MHGKVGATDVRSTSSDNGAEFGARRHGKVGVADGTPTPYKLATLATRCASSSSSHAVDKPIIRLGNYGSSGSIPGAAGGTEYSATAVVSPRRRTGHISPSTCLKRAR